MSNINTSETSPKISGSKRLFSSLSNPSNNPQNKPFKNSNESRELNLLSKPDLEHLGRPLNLPPKSLSEIRKQQKQIRQFEKKLHQRESKVLKETKKNQKQAKKIQESIVNHSKRFDSKLANFTQSPTSEKAIKSLRNEIIIGLPSSSKARTKFWKLFLDQSLVSKSEYQSLIQLAKVKEEAAKSEESVTSTSRTNTTHYSLEVESPDYMQPPSQDHGVVELGNDIIDNPDVSKLIQSVPESKVQNTQDVQEIQVENSTPSLTTPSTAPHLLNTITTSSHNIDSDSHTQQKPPQLQKPKPKPKPQFDNSLITPPTTPKHLRDSLKIFFLDLPRTFPYISFFHKDGPLHQPVINVLRAWTVFRPDVGYIQGLSNVVSILLLVLDEYDAFLSLVRFMENPYYSWFVSMNIHALDTLYSIHQSLFSTFLPNLFRHFEKLEIEPSSYIIPWYIALFSKTLPLEAVTSIWDGFFLDGYIFIFRAAIGLLSYLSPILSVFTEFGEILHFLSSQNTKPKEYIPIPLALQGAKNTRKKHHLPFLTNENVHAFVQSFSIDHIDLLYHIGQINFKPLIVQKIEAALTLSKSKGNINSKPKTKSKKTRKS